MAGSKTGSLYTRHATCGCCRNAWVSAARDIIADEHVIGCLFGPLAITSRSSQDSNSNKISLAHVSHQSEVLIIHFLIVFFLNFFFPIWYNYDKTIATRYRVQNRVLTSPKTSSINIIFAIYWKHSFVLFISRVLYCSWPNRKAYIDLQSIVLYIII